MKNKIWNGNYRPRLTFWCPVRVRTFAYTRLKQLKRESGPVTQFRSTSYPFTVSFPSRSYARLRLVQSETLFAINSTWSTSNIEYYFTIVIRLSQKAFVALKFANLFLDDFSATEINHFPWANSKTRFPRARIWHQYDQNISSDDNIQFQISWYNSSLCTRAFNSTRNNSPIWNFFNAIYFYLEESCTRGDRSSLDYQVRSTNWFFPSADIMILKNHNFRPMKKRFARRSYCITERTRWQLAQPGSGRKTHYESDKFAFNAWK